MRQVRWESWHKGADEDRRKHYQSVKKRNAQKREAQNRKSVAGKQSDQPRYKPRTPK